MGNVEDRAYNLGDLGEAHLVDWLSVCGRP
jgi:hypothetical protein